MSDARLSSPSASSRVASRLALPAQDEDVAALRHYEQARLDRTAAIVRGSSENTKRFHNPALGDAAGAAAYVDREFQPEKVAQRYDWLYEYNALTVAI